MSRAWAIPLGIAFALSFPLIVLGEIFAWPPEATGWPILAITGATALLHGEMQEREGRTRQSRRG